MTNDTQKLSCYILTCNSERYLTSVISPIRHIIDDLVIVDSGSTDLSKEIAERFNARFLVRQLDNFREQRQFALQACQYQWVLSLDSDEVPDETFATSLAELKAHGFLLEQNSPNAYRIRRQWFICGRKVHAFYPITSPDYPIRLFKKDEINFREDTKMIHETPKSNTPIKTSVIPGSVSHYSCDSVQELYEKLNLYTSLAAQDLNNKGVRGSWLSIWTHPVFAWFRWYIQKGGWRDGDIGIVLGRYAYDYTYQKYLKLKYDFMKK